MEKGCISPEIELNGPIACKSWPIIPTYPHTRYSKQYTGVVAKGIVGYVVQCMYCTVLYSVSLYNISVPYLYIYI